MLLNKIYILLPKEKALTFTKIILITITACGNTSDKCNRHIYTCKYIYTHNDVIIGSPALRLRIVPFKATKAPLLTGRRDTVSGGGHWALNFDTTEGGSASLVVQKNNIGPNYIYTHIYSPKKIISTLGDIFLLKN